MSVELNFNNNCKGFYREELCKIVVEEDFFDDEVLAKFNGSEELEKFVNDRVEIIRSQENTSKFTVADFLIHVLDNLIATILIPFFIWQKISASECLMKIIKITLEVILELILLSILAGVSILTAIILLIDDSDPNPPNNSPINQSEKPTSNKSCLK